MSMSAQRARPRVVAIDLLRGFALLGILIMNVQAFAMPVAAYFSPLAFGSFEGLNRVAWLMTRLFFDVKFLSVFSVLFGASLVLAGDGDRAMRRLGWLIVFGLIHGYTLFFGDILFTYGAVGLVVLRARDWPIARQTRWGFALAASGAAVHAALGFAFPQLPAWLQAEIGRTVSSEDVEKHLAVFRAGWFDQLRTRASLSFENHILGTLLESGWQSAGCMLLGMAAARARFFEGHTRWHRHGVVAFVLGLTVTGAGVAVGLEGSFAPRAWLFSQALHLGGCVGVAFGWVTAVMALARAPSAAMFTAPIARLGRVAFSAYILQSIAGQLVFGGQGLGLYGSWDRALLLVAPVLFWLVQIALAVWWTSRFRFGPLEALWRGLYRGDYALGVADPSTR
jgi:uncharacterized protein